VQQARELQDDNEKTHGDAAAEGDGKKFAEHRVASLQAVIVNRAALAALPS
jgi:hypothetical protein